jgi:two-component system cell cycle sensor histidine kinase/response regulator CckA
VRDSNDAITIQDFEGRITAWNRGAERMYGYGEAEALAMNIERLTVSDKVAEQKDFVRRLLAGEAVTSLETQRVAKDGRVLDVWMTVTKLVDEAGKPIGIASTERDITERKRAEESLARLATAVEQSAESVTITDTNAKILYVNPAFEKISGYTRAEVLGQNPRLLKSGKHDAAFYRQMWDVLTRGEVWHGHFINQRQDGKLYEEEATISPIREAEGKVVNYVGVKRDVTHEMQLEEQTRQMQKMEAIGTLAGGVAHDFNNILAVIQMQADLLKAGGNLSPAQFDFAEQIDASVQRAAALTRQLLLFSRKEVLQLHDLDLNQSLSNLSKMLQRILGENIQTQFKFAPHPLFIHADAGMMDQVLMNLVINSRDAMPEGGRLVIETAIAEFDEAAVQQSPQVRPGSFVCLSVSDTGCGIPAEILPRIFEPFFTTKGVGKGTGLGLATVFGIVQQHQGWIHVYSEPGHGTTFRIYLPWLSGTTDQTIAEKLLVVPLRGGNETILVVEDDAFLRGSVCKALSQLGYLLLEAGNAAEALAVWQLNRAEIHLLLTDLVMPGDLNGRELAERLLQEKPQLKVIYASGYSAEVAAKNFPLAEGVNFLAKPFQTFKLAQTVRKNLDANLPPVAPA